MYIVVVFRLLKYTNKACNIKRISLPRHPKSWEAFKTSLTHLGPDKRQSCRKTPSNGASRGYPQMDDRSANNILQSSQDLTPDRCTRRAPDASSMSGGNSLYSDSFFKGRWRGSSVQAATVNVCCRREGRISRCDRWTFESV